MIRTFFGKPGVGKTTLAVKIAKQNTKKYSCCLCNFEQTVPGVATCELDLLGGWSFLPGSYIALDEAGIEFNSRAYKTLPKSTISWFKLHRHFSCDIDVFSQAWDDMDISIRRLSNELWYMYRIGPWTLCRRVYQRLEVDQNTHQIITGYKLASMLWLLIWPLQLGYPFEKKFMLTFRPFYYRYFDSWEIPDTPIRYYPVLTPLPAPIGTRIKDFLARLFHRADEQAEHAAGVHDTPQPDPADQDPGDL